MVLANSIGVAVRYVFGAWMIFSGISRLITALPLDKNSNTFITQIVIASLLILIGLYTILAANLALQVVGIVMMIYAVLEIIAILSNKPVTTSATQTFEKIETIKNDDNVKEAKIIEEKDSKKKKK